MKAYGKMIFSVTVITLFARLLSLVGVQLYMSFFGPQNSFLNMYSYALNIPNLIFNCIGTSLTMVVIPVYSSLLAKEEHEESNKFLNDIISISCFLIIFLIIIGWIASPFIANLTGYRYIPENRQFLIFALRVLMPVMFFYGLNYIFQGVLQSNGNFRVPAFVTVPSSITIILYILLLGKRFGVKGLLFSTVLGLALQVAILIPFIRKTGYRYKFSIDLKNKNIINAGKLILPVLISVSSYQINMWFNSTLATKFDTVTIMSYVQNLILVSILSVIYSITGVYFPNLTKLWALNNKEEFKNILYNIISTVIFLLIPATAGFIALRLDIINLLAKWGDFSLESAIISSNMLGLYAFGIVGIGIKEILDKAFYSQQDTKIPAIFGFIIMISNIILSTFFLKVIKLGTYSMPLAYSIASFIGALGLCIIINRRIRFIDKNLFILIFKSLFATFIMLIFVYFVMLIISDINILNSKILTRIFKTFVPSIVGVIIYFIMAIILKINLVYTIFVKDKKRID